MTKTIPKQVLAGLKNIVSEAAVETLKEPGRMVGLIKDENEKKKSGSNFDLGAGFDPVLGKVTEVNPDLLKKYEENDRKKTQEEMGQIKGKLTTPFRDVEGEMEKVRTEKDRQEEEEERFLEQVKKQREAEEAEGQDELVTPVGKKARGTAFLGGKKKAAGTGELAKNKD